MRISQKIKNLLTHAENGSSLINLHNVDVIRVEGNKLFFYFSWGKHELIYSTNESALHALDAITDLMKE